jgi:hypothetical protein
LPRDTQYGTDVEEDLLLLGFSTSLVNLMASLSAPSIHGVCAWRVAP